MRDLQDDPIEFVELVGSGLIAGALLQLKEGLVPATFFCREENHSTAYRARRRVAYALDSHRKEGYRGTTHLSAVFRRNPH
jgi:hypothetical protein